MNLGRFAKKQLADFWYRLELNIIGRWIFLGILIGLVSGVGAWVFMLLLRASHHLFSVSLRESLAPLTAENPDYLVTLLHVPRWWLIPLIPALGGLISGLLVFFVAPEAEGHGTDGVINSFHRGRGLIRARVPLIKILASAAVIGSGGSAGREGPIAQIGAGFGSLLGRWLKVPVKERRLLLLAGAAAGISAIFQAPLGAAIFSTEVLYRNHELETEALIPGVIASLTAYSLYTRIAGQELLFNIPPLRFERAEQLIGYTVLGLACAWVGVLYVRLFYGFRDKVFRPLNMPIWLKPAMGGALLGLLSIFLPQVWGGGYDVMQQAMLSELTTGLMLLLVFGKIFATSFTISSGGSGGVFAPSLFIGAMLGGGIGNSLAAILPAAYVPQLTAMVVVGMGGFFAGIAKVPIASIIMVSEMTGGYGLLVPMMLVSTITVLFTRKDSLYEKQALGTIDSPAHRGDFITDLLDGLTTRDTQALQVKPVTARPVTTLSELLQDLSGRDQNMIPVVNAQDQVCGMVYVADLREVLFEGGLDLNLIIAADVVKSSYPFTTPEENLHEAITKFTQYGLAELPVLDQPQGRLIGLLTRHDVMNTYNQKLEALQSKESALFDRAGFL